MATLVLTAVGTALGGPLGGALGALIGQSADALLFAPKARQGPRLTDLKIQTSRAMAMRLRASMDGSGSPVR